MYIRKDINIESENSMRNIIVIDFLKRNKENLTSNYKK